MASQTLNRVAARMEAILPDPAVRRIQLSIFAESLGYIHDRSTTASGWLTHLLRDRVRLFAGRLIVMTLQDERVWLPTDASGEAARLSELASWQWDTVSYPEYRRPPARNGFYRPGADHRQDWVLIRKLHFAYLDRLPIQARAADRRSLARHEPLVVEYLSAAIQRPVPAPLSVRFPGEISLADLYWEGAVARVAVNRFERDREAREDCLRYFGRKCAVCGMSFALKYGTEVDWLIHVHHVIPLSEIREGYAPDPVRDLVPVCPNGHAVIHAGGATRTIEEVREMLVRAAEGG